jgi:hypothetical protein
LTTEPLPLPGPDVPEPLRIWAQQFTAALEIRLTELASQAGSGWQVGTHTPNRVVDNTLVLADLADVVSTLVSDLINRSKLG